MERVREILTEIRCSSDIDVVGIRTDSDDHL